MIEEDYVSFEQAKQLKELGFPQSGFSIYYSKEGDHLITAENVLEEDTNANEWIAKPTLSLVSKWLREEKSFFIYITPLYDDSFSIKYIYTILHLPEGSHHSLSEIFKTYEEALEVGINKALELI